MIVPGPGAEDGELAALNRIGQLLDRVEAMLREVLQSKGECGKVPKSTGEYGE